MLYCIIQNARDRMMSIVQMCESEERKHRNEPDYDGSIDGAFLTIFST